MTFSAKFLKQFQAQNGMVDLCASPQVMGINMVALCEGLAATWQQLVEVSAAGDEPWSGDGSLGVPWCAQCPVGFRIDIIEFSVDVSKLCLFEFKSQSN